jgi:hypothetical protein
MKMEKYLIFDRDTNIIKYVVQKIKCKKMIIFSKTTEDISKFQPNHVFCFNNIDVVEESVRQKVRCTNIVTASQFRFKGEDRNLSQVFVNLFDLEMVKKLDSNCILSFSILEEVSAQIANNFKPGYHVMINPGTVMTDTVLEYYGLPLSTQKRSPNLEYKGNWSYGLSPLEEFFTESFEKKVNIYIPTYYRFKKTKESIESILEDVEKSQYDVMVYIGDNNSQYQELKDWLSSLPDSRKDKKVKVEVYFGEKNIGKGMMINHLYKNSRKCDYLFSIDSDMKVETENFVDKMLFHLTRIQNCGLISSQQSGLSQHWWGNTVSETTREGMKVGFSSQGIGIAGGCLCLRNVDWNAVGMYRENHDIYTGDDGILTYNIQNKLGKDVLISKDCVMFHPTIEESEKDYAEWKMESWKRDGLKFLKEGYIGNNKKGFYD